MDKTYAQSIPAPEDLIMLTFDEIPKIQIMPSGGYHQLFYDGDFYYTYRAVYNYNKDLGLI